MDKRDLQRRTQAFGLDIIRLCEELPNTMPYWVVGKQLVRCATSVGANYRSACRGKSKKDFVAKLAIVEEKADEARYWLEILADLGEADCRVLEDLHREAGELVAIMVASRKTAARNT